MNKGQYKLETGCGFADNREQTPFLRDGERAPCSTVVFPTVLQRQQLKVAKFVGDALRVSAVPSV